MPAEGMLPVPQMPTEGVAWRGVAWRGVAWRGVAWRGVRVRVGVSPLVVYVLNCCAFSASKCLLKALDKSVQHAHSP